jgi:formate dehydrogenase subunit gamma
MTVARGPAVRRSPPVATASPGGELARYDVAERLVHWGTAVLMLILIVTGAILYFPILALSVGHRGLMENIHVISGLSLLGPLVLGLAGPWRKRLVTDLRRVDRWRPADFDFFRGQRRRRGLPRDKFNGGQKILAAFLGAAMVAALVTGVIMRFAPSGWIRYATGATLVHDALFFGIAIAVVVHVLFALSRPDQLISMFNGRISRAWAKAHAAAWLSEVEASESVPPSVIARELAGQAASGTTSTTSTPWRSIKAKPPPEP